MTFPYPPRQAESPLDPRQSLPTMYDLPFEDPEEDGSQQKVIELQQQLSEFQQQLSESQQQVIAAQEKAERLAAKLRELGIDPEQFNC